MCGISGIVASDRLAPDAGQRVARMRDVIAHRGPDDAGLFVDAQAALGHRRLSIVDLAAGHQPLTNEDGTVWIVFNGEIYNHADVRPELEAAGHRYRTRCDTETIVHAYEQWGDACVEHLRGMFAFAIWDAPRRRLLLARDRLGVKPLYWTHGRQTGCCSDPRSRRSSRAAWFAPRPTRRAPRAARHPLPLGAETLFKGIHRLLPGHTLVFENGTVDDPAVLGHAGRSRRRELAQLSERDAVQRFRDLLEEAVRIRLMADVPLGMFLSGGLDSSAIAALMAGMIDRPLQTFSVAFKQRAFSELDYARQVSTAIKADAHEIVIDDQDFFGALPRLIWHEDEPIAHPSSVPLYFVSELAREHVKVVLTGEGSDELLAGYGKYPRALVNWRAGGAYGAVARIRSAPGSPTRWCRGCRGRSRRYASRSFLAMPRTPEAMFFDNFAAIGLAPPGTLLSPRFAGRATPEDVYGPSRAVLRRAERPQHTLDRLLYADIKTYLVELLMKQDQMSMAASIESRVPFLDHKLVEFAAALPPRLKLRGFTTKWILREAVRVDPAGRDPVAAENGLPGAVRPLDARRLERHGARRPARLARAPARHRRCRRRSSGCSRRIAAVPRQGADAIWSLLNLELWYRTFIDGDGVQTLPA